MLIFNTLDKPVNVCVGGAWFEFKPNQIKPIYKEGVGQFIARERGYLGLVDLPGSFEDLEFRATEEGKKILEDKRKEGINKRIQFLHQCVENLKAMQQDIDKANLKYDARIDAEGELEAMEELHKYQVSKKDEAALKLQRIKKLEIELNSKKLNG